MCIYLNKVVFNEITMSEVMHRKPGARLFQHRNTLPFALYWMGTTRQQGTYPKRGQEVAGSTGAQTKATQLKLKWNIEMEHCPLLFSCLCAAIIISTHLFQTMSKEEASNCTWHGFLNPSLSLGANGQGTLSQND